MPFETLDKLPDLMYDFSANCCEYSITEVIRHAGPKHVMFGTDMPILRMRTIASKKTALISTWFRRDFTEILPQIRICAR